MAEKIKASEAEVQEALALLARVKGQRAKQKERFKNDPTLLAKAKVRGTRVRIGQVLTLRKAVAAGILVSGAEIDAEISKRKSAAR